MVYAIVVRALNTLRHLIDGALHILLPSHCLGCGKVLWKDERQICLHCTHQMGQTYYEQVPANNPLYHRLSGVLPLNIAYALYVYEGPVKNIIHELKYGGRPMAAEYWGKQLGRKLQQIWDPAQYPDVVIPVPLHPKKQLQRGYNQSFHLARGVGTILDRPVKQWVRRRRYTSSQTQMDVQQRWENMQNAFECVHSFRHSVDNLHLLVIDDVITTGATITACALALHKAIPSIRLSIASLATPVEA